jgi:hypothetical protein
LFADTQLLENLGEEPFDLVYSLEVIEHLVDGGHTKFFSRETLSVLMTESGFENIQFQGWSFTLLMEEHDDDRLMILASQSFPFMLK